MEIDKNQTNTKSP